MIWVTKSLPNGEEPFVEEKLLKKLGATMQKQTSRQPTFILLSLAHTASGLCWIVPLLLPLIREEHFQVDLADRNPRSVWERLGSKTLLEKARERVKKILNEYCPPPLDKDTQRDLEKAVREIYEREGVPYTPIPTEW